MIFFIIFTIAGISIGMAYRSLRQLEHMEKVSEAKDELKKGKVLFQSHSSSPSEESPV